MPRVPHHTHLRQQIVGLDEVDENTEARHASHDHANLDNVQPSQHHARDHASRHEPGGADGMSVNAAAGTGSLRTVGSGSLEAAAGDHGHGTHNHDAEYVNEGDHDTAAHDALDIDADTVDGEHATAFADAGHNHDAAYLEPDEDADLLGSGTASDGQVLTADGSSGAAWENAAGGGGTMELIQSVYLNSASQSETVSWTAGAYRAVVVYWSTPPAVDNFTMHMRVNGDSGSNYRWVKGYFTSSGTAQDGNTSATWWEIARISQFNHASGVIILTGVANTDTKTGMTSQSAVSLRAPISAGLWDNTTNPGQLTLWADTGVDQDLPAGSQFDVYGIL